MKVAVYCHVSTEGQEQEDTDSMPEMQIPILE
jgi:DNA invertase Pin-like site-specific DNA recombinase